MSTVINKTTSNFAAWQKAVLSADDFWQLSHDELRLAYLASLAHLAANSHNTQPWHFKYESERNSLKILIETERVLPISDVKGRQAVISLGCALANIEVGLEALQSAFEKQVHLSREQVISNNEPRILVAEYKLLGRKSEAVVSQDVSKMYNAIFSRRVDRGEYDHDRKIDSEVLKKIESMGNISGVKTILINDWGRKVALAELQSQADSFVINNKKFAEELINNWMLENDSLSELGMPGDTFRLNKDQTSKIKLRFKNNLGFESDDATGMVQLGKKGILSCQCVGLLTVEQDNPIEWLNAGITLEKGALLLESEGIAWAVHAGLAEVSQVNMLMLRPIAMTSKRPVVLFRAGYLKNNETRAPHSPRLAFEKVWSQT